MTAVAKLLREKFGDIHPIKTTPAPWFVMKVRNEIRVNFRYQKHHQIYRL